MTLTCPRWSRAIASLLLVASAIVACSGSGRATTFVATGHFRLVGKTGENAIIGITHDNQCFGLGRYSAAMLGTPVVVHAGSTERHGSLGLGDIVVDPNRPVTVTGCNFAFRVPRVPGGVARYVVTVDSLASRSCTAAQCRAGLNLQATGHGS
jgi:hypothetical protein